MELKQLPGVSIPSVRQQPAVAVAKSKGSEQPPPPRQTVLTKRGADILVRVERMMALTFLLSGFLAGGAGVLVASIVYANFDLGLIGIKSFAAAVLGGFGHVGGAMAGGLLLGVVETIGAFYVSSAFKDIIAYTLLILILLLRPQGIFGGGPTRPD